MQYVRGLFRRADYFNVGRIVRDLEHRDFLIYLGGERVRKAFSEPVCQAELPVALLAVGIPAAIKELEDQLRTGSYPVGRKPDYEAIRHDNGWILGRNTRALTAPVLLELLTIEQARTRHRPYCP